MLCLDPRALVLWAAFHVLSLYVRDVGRGGLYEYIENRHMIIVIAEGVGKEPLSGIPHKIKKVLILASLLRMSTVPYLLMLQFTEQWQGIQASPSALSMANMVFLCISASNGRYLTNEVFCCG
ncbi:hypothetical protein V6N13_113302 [Hibiscus sabdariffa]|uniref:Uncharacterized protein n=1 Tax=Hibiscus sabdariffa TaxID=183260 RepID=A0ABR2CU89_9ROSI